MSGASAGDSSATFVGLEGADLGVKTAKASSSLAVALLWAVVDMASVRQQGVRRDEVEVGREERIVRENKTEKKNTGRAGRQSSRSRAKSHRQNANPK